MVVNKDEYKIAGYFNSRRLPFNVLTDDTERQNLMRRVGVSEITGPHRVHAPHFATCVARIASSVSVSVYNSLSLSLTS